MKIAIVSHSALGGSVHFSVALARMLAARGHQVWHVAPEGLPFADLLEGVENLARVELPAPVETDAGPSDLWPVVTTLAELVANEGVDVVNVHYAFPYMIYLVPFRKLIGAPVVGTLHGTDILPTPELESLQQVARKVLHQADALTAPCAVDDELFQHGVEYIPNFAPDPAPDTRTYEKVPHRILHVSNFRPVKNIPLLIHALRGTLDRIGECAAELVLVGEGPVLGEVKALVSELNLDRQVSFLPAITDRDALMREIAKAGAVVLPSDHECCALVFLEAMQCRTLCIGTSSGGTPALLAPDRGMLFEPGDLDRLIHLLERRLIDCPTCEQKIEAAYEWVTTICSPSTVTARYERVYERVVRAWQTEPQIA